MHQSQKEEKDEETKKKSSNKIVFCTSCHKRLNLSNQEKQALVDFLITLTDYNFITDEKFSNPFKN